MKKCLITSVWFVMDLKTNQITLIIAVNLILWQNVNTNNLNDNKQNLDSGFVINGIHNSSSESSIYEQLVHELYDVIPPEVQIEKFWKIYNKSNATSFLQMVRAQLSLFWLTNYTNDEYLLKAANCFNKIKMNPLYNKLNNRIKDQLERVSKHFPKSLEYLFYKRDFCLLNIKYSEMIYQSTFPIDQHEYMVLTWSGDKYYTDFMGNILPIFKNDIEDDLSQVNLVLYGKHYKGYYYRLPKYNNRIVLNDTALNIENYIWSVQLIKENRLIFIQNDYIMCATTPLNGNRRLVHGLQGKTLNDTACQWTAGECDLRD